MSKRIGIVGESIGGRGYHNNADGSWTIIETRAEKVRGVVTTERPATPEEVAQIEAGPLSRMARMVGLPSPPQPVSPPDEAGQAGSHRRVRLWLPRRLRDNRRWPRRPQSPVLPWPDSSQGEPQP